jgi:[ribosomal protein S5]-alanine N-acetyltransferase
LTGDADAASANAAIATARLVLEPLVVAHSAEAWDGLRDPRLYAFLPDDPPEDVGALARRYAAWQRRCSPDGAELWLNWLARETSSGRAVGTFQATVAGDVALVAYVLFAPQCGRGLAREGAAGVVSALFARTPVQAVRAEIDSRNARSIRLVEALGFRRVGVVEGADHFKGARSDEVHYEVTRDAWATRPAP